MVISLPFQFCEQFSNTYLVTCTDTEKCLLESLGDYLEKKENKIHRNIRGDQRAVERWQSPCGTQWPTEVLPQNLQNSLLCCVIWLILALALYFSLCSHCSLLSYVLFSKEHPEKVGWWHLFHYIFYSCLYHYWLFLGIKVALTQPKKYINIFLIFVGSFYFLKDKWTIGWFQAFVLHKIWLICK